MTDTDLLLDLPGLEFGSGIIGACDICKKRQAVIVLQKERFKLCVIDFLNKSWINSKETPGRPLPAYRSDRVWYETKLTTSGTAPAIVLSPTKVVRHPHVLVTPDIYGLTTAVLEAGIRLAREGFEVLLPDVGKTPGFGPRDHIALRRGSGVAVGSSRTQRLVSLYSDALSALRKRPLVDADKGAVVGLSFGGSLGMALATTDPRIKALALAYPEPVAPPDFPNLLACPTLVIVAGRDRRGARARSQLQAASGPAKITFVDLPEAGRNFLARDIRGFQVEPAERAWAALVGFLQAQLLPPPPRPPPPRIVPPSPAAPVVQSVPSISSPTPQAIAAAGPAPGKTSSLWEPPSPFR
jgi:dienelactone hydrolase